MSRVRSCAGQPRRVLILTVFTAVAAATTIVAHTPQTAGGIATFEVASVKRSQPAASPLLAAAMGAGQVAIRPGGRFAAPAVTVRDLVRVAYGVQDVQVAGGPDWAGRDRFDVEATTRPEVTADEARSMLRALLEDRFSLAVRMDTRELSVSVLEPARSDRRLGPQLRRSGPECAPPTPPANLPAAPPPPPPPAGAGRPVILTSAPVRCPAMQLPWHLSLRGVTMAEFANRLTPLLGRLVVDRTDLEGLFDLDLTYMPDPGTPPPMVNGAVISIDAPALPAAVRDQLGLRLETSKAPVDVVVIDRVEPPTEN